jgi:hypothetical protein
LQLTQVTLLSPHFSSFSLPSEVQPPLSQQPFGQSVPLQDDEPVQVPDEQVCPVPHETQAAPFLPHLLVLCEENGTQVVPSQQPVVQVDAPQVERDRQVPSWQVFPESVQSLQAAPILPHIVSTLPE